MKISNEAREAAYVVYKSIHDREEMERAMQSLINSTLDRAARAFYDAAIGDRDTVVGKEAETIIRAKAAILALKEDE